MPTGWRIVKTKLAAQAFDGEGARLHGGRWTSRGIRVVYTSQSVALAALELLVHLQASRVLPSYTLYAVHFDDRSVSSVDRAALPQNWRTSPAPRELQQIGDDWVAGRSSLVLEVPSAIIDTESNYLINPSHPDFGSLVIDPPVAFEWDPRLTKAEHSG